MYSPRIVIVGAGFGGISAAVELRRHGFEDITILERAPDLGGTWFYNSYPGAACDVPSHLYSFSYEQRSDWSRLCSPQQEILHYLRSVADSRGVSDAIRFSQPVSECTFDPCGRRWTVETESGSSYDADMLIVATGQLSRPWIPSLPGLERYAGHSFHSARWDHGYDLAGRRVAVVGTGASAVQFVPEIARCVAAPGPTTRSAASGSCSAPTTCPRSAGPTSRSSPSRSRRCPRRGYAPRTGASTSSIASSGRPGSRPPSSWLRCACTAPLGRPSRTSGGTAPMLTWGCASRGFRRCS